MGERDDVGVDQTPRDGRADREVGVDDEHAQAGDVVQGYDADGHGRGSGARRSLADNGRTAPLALRVRADPLRASPQSRPIPHICCVNRVDAGRTGSAATTAASAGTRGGRTPMQIRVLVIDDFSLVREGLTASLEVDPGIEVVGEASDGEEGLQMAREMRPDVILTDMRMPGLGGPVLLTRIREELPDTRVLVVTASEKAETLLEAVSAGAAGYLTKRVSGRELRHAVITVHGGGSVITPTLARHLLREYSHVSRGEPLSVRPLLAQREQEVLRLLAAGHTDREIGCKLYISPRTVQNHLTRIREKTGRRRRSELARWAVEHSMT